MARFDKYIGEKHGKLTILKVWRDYEKKETMCEYRCDCGVVKTGPLHAIRYGRISSCGCTGGNFRHGKHGQRLYRIWQAMLNRCRNVNSPNFKYYGGSGVRVCDEWKSYIVFEEWALANGYKDGLTIDRIDIKKGYSPDNCHWTTMREQNQIHKSVVYQMYIMGKVVPLSVFCELAGVSYSMILTRLKRKQITIEEIQRKYGEEPNS